MQFANELIKRETRDVTNIHASVITGKMRVSTFTYTATKADTQVTVAYLPAGRARALPTFCRIATQNVTGTFTVGTGSYTTSYPSAETIVEDVDSLSTSITPGTSVQGFSGPVEGWAYNSLDDIPVILNGNFPVGAVVKGVIVYNVT